MVFASQRSFALALVVAPLLVLVTRAREAHAQPARRELVGVLRDAGGTPIEGATVEIRGASARTNSKGAFQLWTPNIDTLTITFRHLGFTAIDALVFSRNGQWDTLKVEMDRTAQRLSGVNVTEEYTRRTLGLRDFEERRAKGHGVFITREEIASRNASRVSDVLRTRRGINLVRLGANRFGARFVTYTGSRGTTCIPSLWLDGSLARGMEVDDLMANTVEAMELYDSFATVPFEFTHSANSIPCGTIVIWTRIPGKRDK